jgi:hypothetical protein
MTLSTVLTQQLTEIEEQIEKLSGTTNIEYLLRQRSYLIAQSGVATGGSGITSEDLAKAIALAIAPFIESIVAQKPKAQQFKLVTTQQPGQIPYGVSAFSIKNDGEDIGEVDGQQIDPGEVVGGAATDGNFLVSTSYNPKGQSFQISYITDVEDIPAPPKGSDYLFLLVGQ